MLLCPPCIIKQRMTFSYIVRRQIMLSSSTMSDESFGYHNNISCISLLLLPAVLGIVTIDQREVGWNLNHISSPYLRISNMVVSHCAQFIIVVGIEDQIKISPLIVILVIAWHSLC
jgi:hypothetical protein